MTDWPSLSADDTAGAVPLTQDALTGATIQASIPVSYGSLCLVRTSGSPVLITADEEDEAVVLWDLAGTRAAEKIAAAKADTADAKRWGRMDGARTLHVWEPIKGTRNRYRAICGAYDNTGRNGVLRDAINRGIDPERGQCPKCLKRTGN